MFALTFSDDNRDMYTLRVPLLNDGTPDAVHDLVTEVEIIHYPGESDRAFLCVDVEDSRGRFVVTPRTEANLATVADMLYGVAKAHKMTVIRPK